jgi:hypothetical protein
MALFEGRKRFYLIPPISAKQLLQEQQKEEFEIYKQPYFNKTERINEAIIKYDLHIVDIEKDDLLYFPSDWFHEVHNLEPSTYGFVAASMNSFYFDLPSLSDLPE